MTRDKGSSELLPFTPHDHDQRVERDPWVYYVRWWWRSQDAWKVGVLRYRPGRFGGRIKVVHKDLLPAGRASASRVAALVEEVRSGRFDPS